MAGDPQGTPGLPRELARPLLALRVPDGLLDGHLHLDARRPLGLGVFGDGGLEGGCRIHPGAPGAVHVVGAGGGVAGVRSLGDLLQGHEIFESVCHPGILSRGGDVSVLDLQQLSNQLPVLLPLLVRQPRVPVREQRTDRRVQLRSGARRAARRGRGGHDPSLGAATDSGYGFGGSGSGLTNVPMPGSMYARPACRNSVNTRFAVT